MTDFSALIGKQMNVPETLITDALNLAHIKYRKIRVPKRSGGHRTIIQPAAELKLIQAWLEAEVLSRLPLSPAASAFRRGASIVINATTHKDSLYSVRVDIKDFFPSIRIADLIRLVVSNKALLPTFAMDLEFETLIRKACFDGDGKLPIGYPTSPSIANATMYEIDTALMSEITADVGSFGRARLTRYADDFVFSTDKPGACRKFVFTLEKLLASVSSPKLELNMSKTRYMSRRGGSTLITGLRINQEGILRVHANYRDHVRLLLKHFSAGLLAQSDIPRLVGHLAFIEHADPRLFTRLSFRHFEDIAKVRKKRLT